jgi:hypothetical protein
LTRHFAELLTQLEHQSAIDPAYLHGLLTAEATINEPDIDSLDLEIAAQTNIDDRILETIDQFSELMMVGQFRTDALAPLSVQPQRWMEGYLQAVNFNHQQWTAACNSQPHARATLALLKSIVNSNTDQPSDPTSSCTPSQIVELITAVYQHLNNNDELEDWATESSDEFVNTQKPELNIESAINEQNRVVVEPITDTKSPKEASSDNVNSIKDDSITVAPMELADQPEPVQIQPIYPELTQQVSTTTPVTIVRDKPKVGRNDLCPCGSGKKFKKCCLPQQ